MVIVSIEYVHAVGEQQFRCGKDLSRCLRPPFPQDNWLPTNTSSEVMRCTARFCSRTDYWRGPVKDEPKPQQYPAATRRQRNRETFSARAGTPGPLWTKAFREMRRCLQDYTHSFSPLQEPKEGYPAEGSCGGDLFAAGRDF
jgi:hypothetical protein